MKELHPTGPWVQPAQAYILDKTSEFLNPVMETVAFDIAEIVPRMRPRLQDLHSPPSFDAESARFRLFDSIATPLKKVCL